MGSPLLTSQKSHKVGAAISKPQFTDERKRQSKEKPKLPKPLELAAEASHSRAVSRPGRERTLCTGISMTWARAGSDTHIRRGQSQQPGPGEVQVTDGGHGDGVVGVVILHGLCLCRHQPVQFVRLLCAG